MGGSGIFRKQSTAEGSSFTGATPLKDIVWFWPLSPLSVPFPATVRWVALLYSMPTNTLLLHEGAQRTMTETLNMWTKANLSFFYADVLNYLLTVTESWLRQSGFFFANISVYSTRHNAFTNALTGYLGSCHTAAMANQAVRTDISVQFCFHWSSVHTQERNYGTSWCFLVLNILRTQRNQTGMVVRSGWERAEKEETLVKR